MYGCVLPPFPVLSLTGRFKLYALHQCAGSQADHYHRPQQQPFENPCITPHDAFLSAIRVIRCLSALRRVYRPCFLFDAHTLPAALTNCNGLWRKKYGCRVFAEHRIAPDSAHAGGAETGTQKPSIAAKGFISGYRPAGIGGPSDLWHCSAPNDRRAAAAAGENL